MSKVIGMFDASDMIKNLETASLKVQEGAAQGVRDAADILREASMAQVPLREGILQNTATVSSDAHSLEAAVSYDTVYAVYQHERLDLRHFNGRKAKYLEGPMNDPGVIQAMLAAVKARMQL